VIAASAAVTWATTAPPGGLTARSRPGIPNSAPCSERTSRSNSDMHNLGLANASRNQVLVPPRSEHYKTGLSRLRHCLGPAVCVKFGEYRGDMKFGRVE
jgi:hypothetical protein